MRSMLLALVVAGCAPYPGADVSRDPDGNLVVQVDEAQSFKALARFVYDDAGLGRAVAELVDLEYDRGVPAGTVLTLPPKETVRRYAETTKNLGSLVRDAERAVEKGEFDKAIAKYGQALEARPDRTDLLLPLGVAELRSGDLDGAAGTLQEAVRARPDDPDVHYAFASTLRRQGNLPRARREYKTGLDLLPEGEVHPRLTYEYAVTLQELGEGEEARRIFQLFLYEFPSDPWVDDAKQRLEQLSAPSAGP